MVFWVAFEVDVQIPFLSELRAGCPSSWGSPPRTFQRAVEILVVGFWAALEVFP